MSLSNLLVSDTGAAAYKQLYCKSITESSGGGGGSLATGILSSATGSNTVGFSVANITSTATEGTVYKNIHLSLSSPFTVGAGSTLEFVFILNDNAENYIHPNVLAEELVGTLLIRLTSGLFTYPIYRGTYNLEIYCENIGAFLLAPGETISEMSASISYPVAP
jgi:hypothetical protein